MRSGGEGERRRGDGRSRVGGVVPWAAGLLGLALCVPGLSPLRAAEEPFKNPERFQYDSKSRRDPFVPLVREGRPVGLTSGTRGETSKPILYGILWDPGGRSIALINDTEVGVGETVGGYQVAEIRRDAVVLTGGGEPVVLAIAFETPVSSPDATDGR